MTAKEAIDRIGRFMKYALFSRKDRGALLLAIESLKKQVPKKPGFDCILEDGLALRYCPSCGISFVQCDSNHCEKCRQKLDWTEEEER